MDEPTQNQFTHQELRKRKLQHGGMHRPLWSVITLAGHFYAAKEFATEQQAELFIRSQQEHPKPAYTMEP